MSIIDTTYFTTTDLKQPVDNINIQSFIDKYENEILKFLLGYKLFKAFIVALADTPDQKWVDLRDGIIEYTYNSETNEYLGIKQMIADYVFIQIVRNHQSFATDSGIKLMNVENAEITSPREKQVFADNDIVDRNVTLNGFILSSNEADSTTYEDYDPAQFSEYDPATANKTNVLNI